MSRHQSHQAEPTPEYIHCAVCGMEWEVSTADPDSTLDDARQHAQRRHPGPKEWHHLIKDGRS